MAEDFFGELGKSLTRATQSAVGKTSSFFESTKISGLIVSEEKEIDSIFQEIGESLVRRLEEGDEIPFTEDELDLIEEIRERTERLLDLKEELADVKGMRVCPVCAELISPEVAFCPHCGEAIVPEDQWGGQEDAGTGQDVREETEMPAEESRVMSGDETENDLSDEESVIALDLEDEDSSDPLFTTLDDVEEKDSAP